MIETKEGIEKVEEIASTPGLDGVYIGPADLALAMGLDVRGDQPQEEHLEMVKHIQSVCKASGIAIGIHTSSLEYVGPSCLRFLLGLARTRRQQSTS